MPTLVRVLKFFVALYKRLNEDEQACVIIGSMAFVAVVMVNINIYAHKLFMVMLSVFAFVCFAILAGVVLYLIYYGIMKLIKWWSTTGHNVWDDTKKKID